MLKTFNYLNSDLERARSAARKGDRQQCLDELELARAKLKHAGRISCGPALIAERLGAILAAASMSGTTFAAFDSSPIACEPNGAQLLAIGLAALWTIRAVRHAEAQPNKKTIGRRAFLLCLWAMGTAAYAFWAPAPWTNFLTWLGCTGTLGIATMAAAPLIEMSMAASKLGSACKDSMRQSEIAIAALASALRTRTDEFNAINGAREENRQIYESLEARFIEKSPSKRL